MNELNVLYYGCPFDLSGYGTVARNHLLGLKKKSGLNVRLRTKKFFSGVSPDLREDGETLKSMERTPIDESGFIFIEHLTPENFYIDSRAKYHICYTPFETDGVPQSWLLGMRAMDEIWVPSQCNKEAYLKTGLRDKNISVIPHGVNTLKFNPDVKALSYNKGGFNFGSIFDWTERKNPIALIRAYYNAFTSGEDVSLTIRTFWRFPIEKTKEYISAEVKKIKSGFSGRAEFPKILFWFETMDDEVMPNFYKSMDCFVLPSRGEGFGLPFAEAMACGVPTIGPEIGGNREFMNSDNSILVGGNMTPINNVAFLKLQPQYQGQSWFDINEGELSKSMRWVYENKDKALVLANNGAKHIASNFTWDNTIFKIYKRLLEIQGEFE